MSVILLVSSAVYDITSFAYTDNIGTLGLSYFAFKEGKECFEKQAVINIALASMIYS